MARRELTMKDNDPTAWWRDHSASFGASVMDCTVGASNWDQFFASGQHDLQQAVAITRMRTGLDRSVLEIGCGMGRLSFALADHFGVVLGMDVSPALLERAAALNHCGNVRFELIEGDRLRPANDHAWDTIFSCEVFHHLDSKTVAAYIQDAFALLRPGGELVLQVNVTPIRLTTRLASLLKRLMYQLGKTHWRGFPIAPGFARRYHSIADLRRYLTEEGFRIDRLIADKPSQTWFVSTKPHLQPSA
jgi:cyclopropane fatty-acyl-phospholipid synthase-like methyltransferase